MKKFLLVSNLVPKEGFQYPLGFNCGKKYRGHAHEKLYSLDRFFEEEIIWDTLHIEDVNEDRLKDYFDNNYDAIFLSGSPFCIHEDHDWIQTLKGALQDFIGKNNQTRLFGICFGLQILTDVMGGKVAPVKDFIKGQSKFILTDGTEIHTEVYHENYVETPPKNAEILAHSPEGMPYFVRFNKNIWGVQPHPERALKDEQKNKEADQFWSNFFKDWV